MAGVPVAPHHEEVPSPVGTVWVPQGGPGRGGGQETPESWASTGLLPAELATGPMGGA